MFITTIRGIQKRINHQIFELSLRPAYQLPPARTDPDSKFIAVTMLCHRDVTQYLVAAQCLGERLTPNSFVVIDDGSLTKADKHSLKSGIENCTILLGVNYQNERLPKYSSWMRLAAISTLVQENYVIQMDADIMILRDIEEVAAAISSEHPIILGTDEGTELINATLAQTIARKFAEEGENHVQCLFESNLDILPHFSSLRYVRGCAGFSGFPRGSFTIEDAISISEVMSRRLGEAWPVWGSEQATTNLLLSNMPTATVLPLGYYDSVERYSDELKLVHFIGSHRFHKGIYRRLASTYVRDRLTKNYKRHCVG